MKIAILGLPQAGKKTLFTLLTQKKLPEFLKAGEIVKGNAKVIDKRIDELAKIYKPQRSVYAETDFILCPDIETGAGNYSWLNEARVCDLLCIIIRDFASEDVFHALGSVDSKRDKDNIEAELLLADLALIETRLDRIAKDKVKRKQTPIQITEEETLKKCKDVLEQEKFLNTLKFKDDELTAIQSLNFITLKTILWCINVHENQISEKYSQSNKEIFYISAAIENDISSIGDEQERLEFMKELGITTPGIIRLNETAYDALGLMSFYTVGPDEVRAWTINKGSLAPTAGGKIHSDIERGFIRVEVFKYNDLLTHGSEQKLKTAGKLQTKGKDYIIEDGDICNFLFNV
ncbi:MAG: hypothetical protein A2381_00620 [Bdellovibrionales bacterium RIFOXYB1_FULL_37_110]|nr:MAG: hypothetical protein A2417_01475 [Bdellovibrionales bacterium RIFOXYC1_FULL_37_79]OFZ58723.1 MAG: hypothetical protein A2381_00620 [Bdellovibrionales bacterium RIFOXYB1_FULL_37_110]OFZ64722.1 MAG: hypothetical protein A2577_06620 [Bdellovibrionales bacterium RIFOXYD1_FULL_36_51]